MPLNPPMKAQAAIEEIKLDEDFSDHAYWDVNGYSIGYGTHEPWVKTGMTCTENEAMAWLMSKIKSVEDAINQAVHVPLYQHEFDALVDFTYNVGIPAFLGSTLLKDLNANGFDEAAHELLKWVYSGGKINRSLVSRREEEFKEFESQDTQTMNR